MLRQGRAFVEGGRIDVLLQLHALFFGDGRQVLLAEFLDDFGLCPQVILRTHQHNRRIGAMMLNLRVPLLLHVIIARRIHNTETNQKHVRLRVTQRSQSVVLLLTYNSQHTIPTKSHKNIRQHIDSKSQQTNLQSAQQMNFSICSDSILPQSIDRPTNRKIIENRRF